MPWNLDASLTGLIFFWAGYALKGKLEVLFKFKWPGTFVFLVLCLAANHRSLRLTGAGLEMFWISYGHPFWVYLSAFCGIFFVVLLSDLFTLRTVRYIGRYSLIFFLWHQAIAYPFVELFFDRRRIGTVAGTVVEIVLSCLLLAGLNEVYQRVGKRRACA